MKRLSIMTGSIALYVILIFPLKLLILKINVGFAVPELIEGLIVSAWIIIMGTKLLKSNLAENSY
jgi:hypothetical membrane protein